MSTPHVGRPREELIRRHAIDDLRVGNAYVARSGNAEIEKFALIGRVRIRTERNQRTGLACDPQKVDIQVLAVRIAVDLHGAVVMARARENARPVRVEAEAEDGRLPRG